MKCPRCGRDTYSKKWNTCTACTDIQNKRTPRTEIIAGSGPRPAQVSDSQRQPSIPSRGRPRKWASEAERLKAYRRRAKAAT